MATPAIPTATASAPFGRHRAVLVVNTNKLDRSLLSEHLEDCGFLVYEAASTSGAMILLRSADTAISLVLCDARTGGQVDGYGLAAWMDVNCRGMPVILTAGELKPQKNGWGLTETRRFLRKPYALAAVVAHIEALTSGD